MNSAVLSLHVIVSDSRSPREEEEEEEEEEEKGTVWTGCGDGEKKLEWAEEAFASP